MISSSSNSAFKAEMKTKWGSILIERNMRFIRMKNLPMCDWDLTEEKAAKDFHYTISKIEEVEDILEKRVISHPDEYWVAYKTPNGVHAFLLSHKIEPWQMAATMHRMNCDALYLRYCVKRNTYACRVSPKPWRKGDFVASYWRDFGSGKILPEHLEVMKSHDFYIRGKTRFI